MLGNSARSNFGVKRVKMVLNGLALCRDMLNLGQKPLTLQRRQKETVRKECTMAQSTPRALQAQISPSWATTNGRTRQAYLEILRLASNIQTRNPFAGQAMRLIGVNVTLAPLTLSSRLLPTSTCKHGAYRLSLAMCTPEDCSHFSF